jgi:hypothetical protein
MPSNNDRNLSDRLRAMVSEIVELETANSKQAEEILKLRGKVTELEEELRRLREPKPPVDSPAVPDVLINLDGKEYRPTGPGELWPASGERRWTWDPSSEVRLILDAKGNQRRIIVQRAWGDLAPARLPALEMQIKVALDGETVYDGKLRVHQNTRPCMTFRREPLPLNDIGPLSALGVLPNYDPDARPSTEFLTKACGRTDWQWKLWSDINAPGTFDPWSENFGVVTRSWVGGIPLANEASMLPPWDVMLAMTGHASLHQVVCGPTWDSSGNYAVHFFDRETGAPYRPDSKRAAALPVLNLDNLPALTSASGLKLPVGDIAHDFGLVNFAALVTHERFYIEELEAWTLLGSLARKGEERASGVYWSGQVRSVAWWLRNLFHLYLSGSDSEKRGVIKKQLAGALRWMNSRFANPAGPDHRPTGICSVSPFRESPWSQFATTASGTVLSGNHHFLAHCLAEIYRSGFEDAEPVLRHVLKVAEGTWKHSPFPYLAPWLQHAANDTASWEHLMRDTFSREIDPQLASSFALPLTIDIVSWWRAAVVAAVDLGEPWAVEALAWVDGATKSSGKTPSISWAIQPTKKS